MIRDDVDQGSAGHGIAPTVLEGFPELPADVEGCWSTGARRAGTRCPART